MEENFKAAFNFVLKAEGGYSNNKLDKGGATNYGITQFTYNTYRHKKGLTNKDVAQITKEEAEKIYYEEYWLKIGADKIKDKALAIVLFDSSVNHGIAGAKKLFEQSGNDVNKLLNLRRDKYKKITEKNPAQKIFYKGWMNRINNLENYIK